MSHKREADVHLIKPGCDSINVDKTSDILVVIEVSEESEFPKSAFGERQFVKDACHHLYCDSFS